MIYVFKPSARPKIKAALGITTDTLPSGDGEAARKDSGPSKNTDGVNEGNTQGI